MLIYHCFCTIIACNICRGLLAMCDLHAVLDSCLLIFICDVCCAAKESSTVNRHSEQPPLPTLDDAVTPTPPLSSQSQSTETTKKRMVSNGGVNIAFPVPASAFSLPFPRPPFNHQTVPRRIV